MERRSTIAVFPGSFNPFTVGHADIVSRALALFDRVVVAVGVNAAKPHDDVRALLKPIEELYEGQPRVDVYAYSCLTVDFASELGATCIIRSVRSLKDYEYERDMADINRQLSGIETVILYSRPELAAVSSSVVRELRSFGCNVDRFLPQH